MSDAEIEKEVQWEMYHKNYDGDLLAKATKIGVEPAQTQEIYAALRFERLKAGPMGQKVVMRGVPTWIAVTWMLIAALAIGLIVLYVRNAPRL